MRKTIIALAAVAALAGCTTTERDVGTGAALGAGVGLLAGGDAKGALIGAAAGAAGGLLVRNLRNGYCEYRNPRTGRLYQAPCR
ncbi:lipoprotein [Oryzicola mucosus]|uniref:Lipoprotein n=1 Tax=Oryzicola mucosus TaxID=2767425 RepID=A0A8J6PMB1_9HYPH|nr:lipoprotein [Oryzicola mucosus]MBD0417244.1 lipoprotein [Oryzicola mucosus]